MIRKSSIGLPTRQAVGEYTMLECGCGVFGRNEYDRLCAPTQWHCQGRWNQGCRKSPGASGKLVARGPPDGGRKVRVAGGAKRTRSCECEDDKPPRCRVQNTGSWWRREWVLPRVLERALRYLHHRSLWGMVRKLFAASSHASLAPKEKKTVTRTFLLSVPRYPFLHSLPGRDEGEGVEAAVALRQEREVLPEYYWKDAKRKDVVGEN